MKPEAPKPFPAEVEEAKRNPNGWVYRIPTITVDAALPFLSLFGGLLIVADLIRIHVPEYPQIPNFALFDFGGSFLELQKMNKRPSPNCVCKSHNAELHKRLNGKTKYWPLSGF
jgi:hypothetical protein